eukprot:gene12876-13002_t
MADTVRYLMEEMVPELEDMVKQRYFSQQEVKQIVKRRQDFEYLLKRRAALKDDFLRVVVDDAGRVRGILHRKLFGVRKFPNTKMVNYTGRYTSGRSFGKKKTLADYAIVRRIHFIFERAVRKFKIDLSLWTTWLEYCRSSNSNRSPGARQLKQEIVDSIRRDFPLVAVKASRLACEAFPSSIDAWLRRLKIEATTLASNTQTLALVLQALKLVPAAKSEPLWQQYSDAQMVESLEAGTRKDPRLAKIDSLRENGMYAYFVQIIACRDPATSLRDHSVGLSSRHPD